MNQLTRERINFIALLHDAFVVNRGYGAYAYISIKKTMTLFDEYLVSKQPADQFIHQYIRSI